MHAVSTPLCLFAVATMIKRECVGGNEGGGEEHSHSLRSIVLSSLTTTISSSPHNLKWQRMIVAVAGCMRKATYFPPPSLSPFHAQASPSAPFVTGARMGVVYNAHTSHAPLLSSLEAGNAQTYKRMTNVMALSSEVTAVPSEEDAAHQKEVKLWGGRFKEIMTPAVEKFSESVSFDKKLYKEDILGSRAHASMLSKQGLMSEQDLDVILQGIDEIERQIESGKFVWRADREDVHMNIEAALIDLVGEPAKKLHTARSRNDQVVTDVRLWCRRSIDQILANIIELQVALVNLAIDNNTLIVPGYTHMQRAQPLLLPHLLLAYVEQLERDAGRLNDCRARLNYSPLGSCALAGTGLPIDRFATALALGFTAPLRNSVDAVSDRDFLIELLSTNSIIAIHLSRLAEEWVLWASEEFGFLTPNDSVSSGSSIMPQKKNPDPMELVRGKSARVIGDLTTILVLCKGLPQAYNRDLQEDKEPLFDSVETILSVLKVTAEFAKNITFNKEQIAMSLHAGHLDATTMADYLVYKGIPFRTSHDIVGKAVALAVSKNTELEKLSMQDLQSISNVFDDDVYSFLGTTNAINKFQSYGSTGEAQVASQVQYWLKKLRIK